MDIQPGTDIGRYHILEKLGEGGMAVVFKAYDMRLENEVAIKFIRTDEITPKALARVLKRFEVEAKKTASLQHPNIVRVMDYGEFKGIPYLVQEYIAGGTLKGKLGKPVPYPEAFALLLPIARALAYAHGKGLVHRDVKPSNILISESGEAMLTDFGIAKVISSEETLDLTVTGMGIGTPEYIAPEQAEGKAIDARADIYALGVVLYELLTGRKPFVADTPMAVLVKHIHDPLPRPSEMVKGLPPQVEQIFFKALAKKPEGRYPCMNDFIKAINDTITEKYQENLNTKSEYVKEKPTSAVNYGEADHEQPAQAVKKKPIIEFGWLIILFGIAAAVIGYSQDNRQAAEVMKTPFYMKNSKVLWATQQAYQSGISENGDNENNTSQDAGGGGAGKKIFLTAKAAGVPYFENGSFPGAIEAANEVGYNLTIRSPQDFDVQEQIRLIETAISEGTDAILVSTIGQTELCPVLNKAMQQGIVVIGWDGDPNCRQLFQDQVDDEEFGRQLTRMMCNILGGENVCSGQIAILSSGANFNDQNTWIDWALDEWKKPAYANMQLVEIVYGDDDFNKSYDLVEFLVKENPQLRGIISPTTVGIKAAAQYVENKDLINDMWVTGFGLPNELREYVKKGIIPQFALWDPKDQAYLAVYMAHALLEGKITGEEDDAFVAGKLGEFRVGTDDVVLLGPPLLFDINNIDRYDF